MTGLWWEPRGNYQSHSNAGFVWDAQTLSASGAAIPASKLPAIEAAAVAACDATDGLVDGLIEEPDKCAFEPETLRCTTGDGDDCLTEAQVASLEHLYRGPTHPQTGAQIFPGWAMGGERGVGDIRGRRGRDESWPRLLLEPGV